MTHLKISQLSLFDFRCFPELVLDFHPHLTVLVAGNGAGKTSVLDAIAVALGPFVGAFDEAVGLGFMASDIRQFPTRRTKSIDMEYAPKGVMLEASGEISDFENESAPGAPIDFRWSRSLSGPTKAKTTVKESKQLVEYAKWLQQCVRTPDSDVSLPMVAYYGTGRLWQQKKLTISKSLPRRSRTIGYTDSLDSASSYKSFVAWFRYWTESAFESSYRERGASEPLQHSEFNDYLDSVSRAVNLCLEPVGWTGIRYSVAKKTLIASHKEHGELPGEILSDGIRNMIGMVADIAFRATKLNPHLGSMASEKTTGIVLVDEIDMHLHPSWQQVVLQSLRLAFPRVQFIVTTHSPQVASTVPDESIRILTAEGVKAAPPGTEGAESNRVLERVFGVDARPQSNEATKELLRYLQLVNDGGWETQEALALRVKLDQRYRGEEPALLEADLQIENHKWEASE